MDNVFTIKNGIKFGIGFTLGAAFAKGLDDGLGILIEKYSPRLASKIANTTADVILGDANERKYTYRPRTEYVRPVRTETPVGDATDV
jgi:hypothetical protein